MASTATTKPKKCGFFCRIAKVALSLIAPPLGLIVVTALEPQIVQLTGETDNTKGGEDETTGKERVARRIAPKQYGGAGVSVGRVRKTPFIA